MSKVNVSLNTIELTTKQALEAHGAAPWVAHQVALAVRSAEARGNLICGLYYLESYCKQLLTGRVNGTATPIVSQPKPSIVSVDAQLGFAQAAFHVGFDTAIAAAGSQGTCSYAIAHAHTCTSLGYFTEQIANAGFIGIGFTNASAAVAPPGGQRGVIGTNPIAMSIPAQEGGIAFQFDQSTSAVALGKITMAAAANEAIPLGWAVDAEGHATTDPHAALKGALVSVGGYKGWGFGLMSEILAAALTGSAGSVNVKGLKVPEGPPHNLGQYYFIVDPTAISGSHFWESLGQLQHAVHEQSGARLPGEHLANPENVSIESSIWDLAQKLSAYS